MSQRLPPLPCFWPAESELLAERAVRIKTLNIEGPVFLRVKDGKISLGNMDMDSDQATFLAGELVRLAATPGLVPTRREIDNRDCTPGEFKNRLDVGTP